MITWRKTGLVQRVRSFQRTVSLGEVDGGQRRDDKARAWLADAPRIGGQAGHRRGGHRYPYRPPLSPGYRRRQFRPDDQTETFAPRQSASADRALGESLRSILPNAPRACTVVDETN